MWSFTLNNTWYSSDSACTFLSIHCNHIAYYGFHELCDKFYKLWSHSGVGAHLQRFHRRYFSTLNEFVLNSFSLWRCRNIICQRTNVLTVFFPSEKHRCGLNHFARIAQIVNHSLVGQFTNSRNRHKIFARRKTFCILRLALALTHTLQSRTRWNNNNNKMRTFSL